MTNFRKKGRGPEPLWVFAQYPVARHNLVIPILAGSREEAIREAESDPGRIGKSLTPKIVAGRAGLTDGKRDFLLFENETSFVAFLQEQADDLNGTEWN